MYLSPPEYLKSDGLNTTVKGLLRARDSRKCRKPDALT